MGASQVNTFAFILTLLPCPCPVYIVNATHNLKQAKFAVYATYIGHRLFLKRSLRGTFLENTVNVVSSSDVDPEIDRVAAGDRSASNYPRLDQSTRLGSVFATRLDSTWARIDRLDRLTRLK